MSKNRKHSSEVRESGKKYREQIRSWRRHPDDPWVELEHLGLTEAITALGWSQTRVTRAMNSVASPEALKLKIHRALQSHGDAPLFMAGASKGAVGNEDPRMSPEEEHGYTHERRLALDADADVIDLSTRQRIEHETAEKRVERITDLILAAEEVRQALDERVARNPDFMRLAGRQIWLIRSKIDNLKRDLRRKAA